MTPSNTDLLQTSQSPGAEEPAQHLTLEEKLAARRATLTPEELAQEEAEEAADQLRRYRSDLTEAAEEGNIHRVRELIPLCAGDIGVEAVKWASINGHAEVLNELLPLTKISQWDFSALIDNVKTYQRANCLEVLLPHIPTHYPRGDFNYQALFVKAAGNTSADMLKVLLPHVDPAFNNSAALKRAVSEGASRCVEFLLPLSDSSGIDASAVVLNMLANPEQTLDGFRVMLPLCRSLSETTVFSEIIRKNTHASWGYTKKLLEMVAEVADASYNDSEALFLAVRNEWADCVEILAKVCDVGAANSRALVWAEEKEFKKICELLYDGSDVMVAWEELNKNLSWLKKDDLEEYKQSKHPQLYEFVSIQRQRAALTEVVNAVHSERIEQWRADNSNSTDAPEEPRRKL